MGETTNARKYFSKNYNQDNTISYSWYNTQYYKLTERGRQELKEYILKRPYIREIVVVDNIEVTRPQRTWGSMPEWFRPEGWCHRFDYNNHSNSFIFILYDKECLEEDIIEAFKSFPETTDIYYIKGDTNE